MAPKAKEPTRAQLSSRLAYQQHKPNFLLKLQNRINGIQDDEDEFENDEFEYVGEGREPIPRRPRPAIPERPPEDPGSADEEFEDEKPQVVVLKAGKHLTELEAENIRKGKPQNDLPSKDNDKDSKYPDDSIPKSSSSSKKAQQSLSFSSSSKPTTKSNKRKLDDLKSELEAKAMTTGKSETKHTKKPKTRKEKKTLLSFTDDT